ncbi:MAG: VapB-type antitoxin [Thermoproteota archaeon]|nr:MAG: VapB-type antitoxin [Candidatus Korarchaeota archaeon]
MKSKTTVYSIRIPVELRKLMDSVDVNWQEEIRKTIEQRLRKEIRKKMLKEARELRKRTKRISSAELIRADRDAR